jgi:protein-S-isoprenylcysteine O-methyltransferase Ste14
VLIGLEALVSVPAVAALPPRAAAGWASFGAGIVVAAVGGWLALRGLRDLGPNLTALPAPRRDALLVESGIYARVRHPIYAGVIAGAFGWGLVAVSGAALAVAVLLAVWLDLKSRREEAWLLAHHAGYAAYRTRTRRFVPSVY